MSWSLYRSVRYPAAAALVVLAACADGDPTGTPQLKPGVGQLADLPAGIAPQNAEALAGSGAQFALSASGTTPAIISNGTVQLGVNPHAQLNVGGGSPSLSGTTVVGLRYVPTGAESTAPGCACEGWGVADKTTGATGYANQSTDGGPRNLVLESFESDSDEATSVVKAANTFRVTHEYRPAAATANAYEVLVTIENISNAPTEVLYRRVMDWDIEPTPFAEMVTIKRGTAANLYRTDNNGFNSANPLWFGSGGYLNQDFEDVGPYDHGALFDFNFGIVEPGKKVSFRTFYGAAGNEVDAKAALGAVGAEAYSLGQPSSTNGASLGVPNTFFFGFSGVGGVAVEPPPVDNTPPAIVPTVAGTLGAAGWYTSDVTVSWTVTDTSPITSEEGCALTTVTDDTTGQTFTCSATSAGGTSSESVTIKRDAGDPTISGSASASGWTNQSVAVTFTCTDATSGVASCGPNQTLSGEGADQSVSGSAADKAGNTASATVSNIDIDKTKPVVSFSGNAGSYTIDQVVAITCSATDALSGIESSTCPSASGPAYTFTLGTNTLSASATDKADNTSTASSSFTVGVTAGSLCALTRQFVSNAGIASSLCEKLDAAAASAARGNSNAKSGQIGAYINHVEAQSGKSITAANAQILIKLAQAL